MRCPAGVLRNDRGGAVLCEQYHVRWVYLLGGDDRLGPDRLVLVDPLVEL